VFAVVALLAIAYANKYTVTVDYLDLDENIFVGGSGIHDTKGFYLAVTAHSQNGTELGAFTTQRYDVDNSSKAELLEGRYLIGESTDFEDVAGKPPITKLWVTMYYYTHDGHDDAIGYSNMFYEIPSDICDEEDSKDLAIWGGWWIAWDKIGDVLLKVEADNSSCNDITTTTEAPWDDPAHDYNFTYAKCELWSFNSDFRVECDSGDSADYDKVREYYGLCEETCPGQVLRTGDFGARECGHDADIPDAHGNHHFWILPCEYGMFRIDDGAAQMSIVTVILVAVIAFIST